MEARVALMEGLARLERGLEDQAQTRAVADVTLQDLHSTVIETRDDLIRTVEYIYSVCSQLTERAESERLDRYALLEWMSELAQPATIEPTRSGERILGGSFSASSASSASPGETIDIVEIERQEAHWTS
jgi:hypothetical protein